MDNRDINEIRDMARRAVNQASEYHERRARGEALARNDKMMRDLNRWGRGSALWCCLALGFGLLA